MTAIDDDIALARRAAAGDGDAFAALYERYERRVYNLCLRIVASEDDAADATQEAFVNVLRRLPSLEGRELAFGSYVFTSARNACYDQIARHKRAEPSDEIAESATPVGSATGGGGIGFDPGDPEDDPERNVLQRARTEEIAAANATLPERQREALALKELEGMSYDEIADVMGMNRNSVAQLISRARINLRDALRGTALASIASSTPDCERALPLIAARDDGQLDDVDGSWLTAHLAHCETCGLAVEAMAEAGVSYRAWAPVAAAPFLLRETLARAAELTGSDWTESIERAEARRASRAGGRLAQLMSHPRVDAALATALAALVLLVALVGNAGDASTSDELAPRVEEAAAVVPATTPTEPAPKRKPAARKPQRERSTASAPASDEPAPEAEPAPAARVPAVDAADPVTERSAARRRKRTVDRDTPPTRGGLDPVDQPVEPTTPPPTPTPEPRPEQPPAPEPPPEPEPERPSTTPCSSVGAANPCPQPPQPPRACRSPSGAVITCGLRTP